MEIERKFWIDGFPEDCGYPLLVHKRTEQGYLACEPIEVRIRRAEDCTAGGCTYILTIKSEGELARHEVETALTEAQYEELKSLLGRPMIRKDYRAYRLPDGYTLECSVVDDGVFSYAEVEFPSLEEAEAWQPLPCLGRETTYEKGFKMHTYWQTRTVPGGKDRG